MKAFKKIGKQPKGAKVLSSKIVKKPLSKPNLTIHEKEENILNLQQELKRKLAAKSFEDFVNEDLDTEDESSISSFMRDSDEAEFTGEESEQSDEEQATAKRSKEVKTQKIKVTHGDNAEKQTSSTETKKTNKTATSFQKKPKHVEKFDDWDLDSSETDEDEPLHTLPDTLELASDDSDFEDLADSIPARPINTLSLAQIDQWHEDLQNDKTTKTVRLVMVALNSALASLHSEESKREIRIEGSNAFNAIVRLCLVRMLPSFKSLLKISPQEKRIEPTKSKNWAKVKTCIRQYLLSVIKLLNGVYSEHLLSVVLKHIHQAMPFFASIQKTGKFLCKQLFSLWSSGEESVRVLAFMCLLKLCTLNSQEYLEPVMKGMYLSYVKNTKFTAPKTLPGINFMRRSLVEIFALDDRLAYRHGFLYIRQLAIHLRNALTTKKKDSVQVVYNWQFIHSLNLWASIIGVLHDSVNMRQLIYPLVQVIIGTINLMATAKYYPLRFHCAKILTQLSSQTKTFIPVLPFYADILQNHNFNRKLENSASGNAVDLSCILKVSTSQLKEESYRDSVIEHIHSGILEYAFMCSTSVTFPETIFPSVMQIKTFMKKFSNGTYNKKMKILIERLMENSKFIEDKRKTVTFGIADTESIHAWETQLRLNGTPFMKFYGIWRKEYEREEIRKANKPEEANFDQIPVIKKRLRKDIEDEDKGFEGLFPSGDEETENEEERFMLKEERGKGVKRPIEPEDKPVKEPKKVRGGDKNTKQLKKAPPLEEGLEPADEVEDLHLSDLESEISNHETSDNDDSDE